MGGQTRGGRRWSNHQPNAERSPAIQQRIDCGVVEGGTDGEPTKTKVGRCPERSIELKTRFASLLFLILIFAQARVFARDICGERKPSLPGFTTVHGIVLSQFEIGKDDHEARLGKRSRLIEIERLWGLGSKHILPEAEYSGRIQAVQIDLFLKLDTLAGVRFWSLGMFDQGRELENLMPKGQDELFIKRGDKDEWRTLLYQLNQPVPFSDKISLDFNARTIFHQPWNPRNIVAGTRVDACVYFLTK